MKELQKARAGQAVSDELLATYTAAKAFLIGEWAGALLLLYSFTHLYIFGLRPGAVAIRVVAVAVLLLVVGAMVFLRSRRYYLRLDFPWKKRWDVAATVFAGSAAVFWFLFALGYFLVWRGVSLF